MDKPETLQTYCVVDQQPISYTRAMQRSITCSPECARQLAKIRRQMIDTRRCRLCGVPSTPDQRKQFLQWRRETGQFRKPGRPATTKTPEKEAPTDDNQS